MWKELPALSKRFTTTVLPADKRGADRHSAVRTPSAYTGKIGFLLYAVLPTGMMQDHRRRCLAGAQRIASIIRLKAAAARTSTRTKTGMKEPSRSNRALKATTLRALPA